MEFSVLGDPIRDPQNIGSSSSNSSSSGSIRRGSSGSSSMTPTRFKRNIWLYGKVRTDGRLENDY